MAKIEQYSRLINHGITTAGAPFSVPTSNDHSDGTWLATDLYIGEIGINVTDDTVFMRTNNGIIQIATGTSSGSTSSTSGVFLYNAPNIEIGSTYSADAVTPRSGYYTDLGDSSLRWKDLYLGGAANGLSTINVNGGLSINEASEGILVTNNSDFTNAPIEIGFQTSVITKDRPLWLNTRQGSATGSTNYVAAINSLSVAFSNNDKTTLVSASQVYINDSVYDHVHLGYGYGKTNYTSRQTVVGGSLAVRGVTDDGSTQYDRSDWVTSQELLRTSNANTTTIVTIPWTSTASGGDVVQVKGYLIGTDIADATLVYSAEIMGCYSITGTSSSLTVTEIGVPVLNAQSNWSGNQPDCEMAADASGVYIQVTGIASTTIQWLCSYSYHKLINVY
jgi:hypothetical protein